MSDALSFVNRIGRRSLDLVAGLAERATVTAVTGGLATVQRVGRAAPDGKPYAVLGGGGPGVGTDGWLVDVPGQGAAFLPFGPTAPSVFDVTNPAFGAVGDDATDDTAAMQACADACLAAGGVFYVPPGRTFCISATLDLRMIVHVRVEGVIRVMHTTDPGVVVGGDSSALARDVYVYRVRYGGAQSNVSIQVKGLQRSRVTIGMCDYLQLWTSPADPDDASIAYNNFHLTHCITVELLQTSGGNNFINENQFHGGRVQHVVVDDEGSGFGGPNNNRFYDCNFENGSITVDVGRGNYFRGRFEANLNDVTVDFGADAFKNLVVQTFYNANYILWPQTVLVTDAGFGNEVTTERLLHAVTDVVWRVDAAARTTDVASDWHSPHATNRVRPGFRKIAVPSANSIEYFDTGVFPVVLEGDGGAGTSREGRCEQRNFLFLSDAAIWRPKVYVYDEDRVALDGASTDYVELTGTWSWNAGGYYTFASNRDIGRITFSHPDVRFARIVVGVGVSLSTTSFEYAQLVAYVLSPYGRQVVDYIRRQSSRPLLNTGSGNPTQSLLRKGDAIVNGTTARFVTERVDTTLTGASAASDTTLTVASIAGINSGDNVAVLLDDGTTHFTTVNGAPSGSTVTIATGVPSAAAVGNDVATQRWGTNA